uniref:WAP domain-containing protein n=1 Tax=Salarias fasciatus TaxID=181472 RepID=A0A672FBY1_SALFA
MKQVSGTWSDSLDRQERRRCRKKGKSRMTFNIKHLVLPCQYNPWGSCSSDFQCPGNEKCCNNGCGNVCVDPYTGEL